MTLSNINLYVRDFETADVGPLLEIRNSNLNDMIDGKSYTIEVINGMISRVTKDVILLKAEQSNYHIKIAEVSENGKRTIVGSGALVQEKENEADIRLLFTHPDYQNAGVGSSLLRSLEELAKEKKIAKIALKASVVASKNFYPKHGYAAVSEEVGDMGRVILMSKELVFSHQLM